MVRICLFFVFVALAGFCAAQSSKSISIERLGNDQHIVLDGLINEEVWLTMTPITDFTMQEPLEGGEPTERTEVRIAYDAEHLYMAVTLYDSDPAGIKAFQTRRDAENDDSDSFIWFFDTFLDKRNAYIFEINPAGLMADALLTTGQGSDINRDWDGIWEVETHIGT
ncbi:MAG: carbohydrate binding family 9 domain-containing protein, partial [Saprospiraceae bacterium]|nr:carbohydrate binding family 9 domain-containing protein [Saprospiraceae bacterium]